MRKELDYFWVAGGYGWDQERFKDRMMNLGGCAAVTACDSSIYLTRYKGIKGICPFDMDFEKLGEKKDSLHVSEDDYVSFSKVMKPYLRPRFGGIDRLSIYTMGYGKYLKDIGNTSIEMGVLYGEEPVDKAIDTVISQIDKGYPIPVLTLRHRNPLFSDYVWHWYLITGYEKYEDEGRLMVKVVSYGEFAWFDFNSLWDTGHRRKGGLILFNEKR